MHWCKSPRERGGFKKDLKDVKDSKDSKDDKDTGAGLLVLQVLWVL